MKYFSNLSINVMAIFLGQISVHFQGTFQVNN